MIHISCFILTRFLLYILAKSIPIDDNINHVNIIIEPKINLFYNKIFNHIFGTRVFILP